MTVNGILLSDPEIMTRLLLEYWQKVESWPSEGQRARSLESIEDHLAAFLAICAC